MKFYKQLYLFEPFVTHFWNTPINLVYFIQLRNKWVTKNKKQGAKGMGHGAWGREHRA